LDGLAQLARLLTANGKGFREDAVTGERTLPRWWGACGPTITLRAKLPRDSVKIDYNRATFADLGRSRSGEFAEGERRISIPRGRTLRSERNR